MATSASLISFSGRSASGALSRDQRESLSTAAWEEPLRSRASPRRTCLLRVAHAGARRDLCGCAGRAGERLGMLGAG